MAEKKSKNTPVKQIDPEQKEKALAAALKLKLKSNLAKAQL